MKTALLSVVILFAFNTAWAAKIGDTFTQAIICMKADDEQRQDVPDDLHLFSANNRFKSPEEQLEIEKYAGKPRVARLVAIKEVARDKKKYVIFAPVFNGDYRLVLSVDGVKPGEEFPALMESMKQSNESAKYVCKMH